MTGGSYAGLASGREGWHRATRECRCRATGEGRSRTAGEGRGRTAGEGRSRTARESRARPTRRRGMRNIAVWVVMLVPPLFLARKVGRDGASGSTERSRGGATGNVERRSRVVGGWSGFSRGASHARGGPVGVTRVMGRGRDGQIRRKVERVHFILYENS